MIDLFTGLWVHRQPEKISGDRYFYLWMSNDYEYHLVIENNELRIYSYDYWSEDTIQNNHRWEEWWGWLHDCFEWMYDCYTKETMRYMPLNTEWKDATDIAKLIVDWTDTSMKDDVSYSLVENNDWVQKIPSKKFIEFVAGALKIIGNKVYQYYK